MTHIERKIVMGSLVSLNKNRDKNIKAKICANGSTQQAYFSLKETSSITAALESIITAGVIDAKHKIDVNTLDILNAFVQN